MENIKLKAFLKQANVENPKDERLEYLHIINLTNKN
jgi:hypothetical protein